MTLDCFPPGLSFKQLLDVCALADPAFSSKQSRSVVTAGLLSTDENSTPFLGRRRPSIPIFRNNLLLRESSKILSAFSFVL